MAIISGTGVLIQGTTLIIPKGPFNMALEPATFTVGNGVDPQSQKRVASNKVTLTLTPDGRITAAQLALIFGSLPSVPGTNLFADTPWTLITTNGEKFAFTNMAITSFSNLKLASNGTVFAGSITLTGIPVSTGLPSAANAIYTYSTGQTFPGYADTLDEEGAPDGAYALSDAKTEHFSLAWKDASATAVTGFSAFYGRQGVDVTLRMRASEVADDRQGISGMLFAGIDASMSLMPVGPTQAQMDAGLLFQGTGAGPGRTINTDGYTLVATSASLVVTLNNAGLQSDSRVFDPTNPRQGNAVWVGGSDYSGTTWKPALSVALAS